MYGITLISALNVLSVPQKKEKSKDQESERKALENKLLNGTQKEKLEAARRLERMRNPDSIPVLLKALEDEKLGVRAAAARALGNFDNCDNRITAALMRLIKNKSELEKVKVKVEAIRSLGQVLSVIIPINQLVKKNPSYKLYGQAKKILEACRANVFTQAVQVLTRAFKGTPCLTNVYLVGALAMIDDRGTPALINVFRLGNDEIKKHIAYAVIRLLGQEKVAEATRFSLRQEDFFNKLTPGEKEYFINAAKAIISNDYDKDIRLLHLPLLISKYLAGRNKKYLDLIKTLGNIIPPKTKKYGNKLGDYLVIEMKKGQAKIILEILNNELTPERLTLIKAEKTKKIARLLIYSREKDSLLQKRREAYQRIICKLKNQESSLCMQNYSFPLSGIN